MERETSERLDRLERESRRWRWGFALLALAVAGGVLMGQAPAPVVTNARYAMLPPAPGENRPEMAGRVLWRQLDMTNGTVYELWTRPNESARDVLAYYVTTINPMTGLFVSKELGK